MKQEYKTLEDHITLFRLRGFTESGLGMKSKPGFINEVLRSAFSKASWNAIANASKPQTSTGTTKERTITDDFSLLLRAKFDAGCDRVDFKVKFNYNLETDSFRIRSVVAKMESIELPFPIAESSQLQNSNKMYLDLRAAKAKTMTQSLHIMQSQPRIKYLHI